jgi:aspartate/methionine/tyrosine aminotransferase
MREFELEAYFARWEFAVQHVLAASDAESLSLGDLLALATPAGRAAFDSLWLGYTETAGAPDLRAAIASTYDAVEPDDVLVFAGAEEAIYTTMHVVLDRDDHAIIVTPNYQSSETVPMSRCDVTGVALDAFDGWSLDVDRIAAAVRPTTKLLYINFPNNPTGKILEPDRFDAIVELCRRHGIRLFSDEVFRLLDRDESMRLPQAVDLYERALSLNVMSKAYGLPGLRIGWIACRDRELLGRLERFKNFLTICSSGPSERLAVIALGKNARETIVERNRRLANDNVAIATRFFEERPDRFEWYVPDGGCIGFPRYLGEDGVEAFTRDLIEQAGVLLVPASKFRSELAGSWDDRFRIGFGRKDFPVGLEAMGRWLRPRE